MKKLKKDTQFFWTDIKVLQLIKNEISNVPTVYFPKIGNKLILETDVFDHYWGCVLKAIPLDK